MAPIQSSIEVVVCGGSLLPPQAADRGIVFPADIIGHSRVAVFLFPLGLRMVRVLLAARGIIVSRKRCAVVA